MDYNKYMKISDPIMKEFNIYDLKKDARKHLEFVLNGKNKEDVLFRLAGFYGGLVEVLKEKYNKV
jgi:hypothetical protein